MTKPRVGDALQRAGVSAEEDVCQQQDDADAAAPEGDAAGAADATPVEDLARVEPSIGFEDHGRRARYRLSASLGKGGVTGANLRHGG